MNRKELAGKASFQLVRFFLFLSRFLPLKASYVCCTAAGSAISLLNWKRKRIALANLNIVFPEISDADRRAIFKKSLIKLLKNVIEICFLAGGKWSARDVEDAVTASGLEYLDELKASGMGGLLYSGHFGNFPLMVIWLAVKGYPVAAVYKEAKNFPDDFFGAIMSRFGVTPITYKSDPTLMPLILKSLREKKIILVQNDQSHPHGVYINFFNKSVPSLPGPALLSLRQKVPIIPAYIIRDTNDHHHLTILPEMDVIDSSDRTEYIIRNTQLQLDWIAKVLKAHPTEWLWLHNRWKRAR